MQTTSVPIWVGNYGNYVIPPELRSIKITRTGQPDKRTARAAEMWAWVKKQEQAARPDNADLSKVGEIRSVANG